MTAEQSIRNIEREAAGRRNVDNIFAAITPALVVEPPFKVAGHEYTDTTGRIPAGHATITHWYDDDDEPVDHIGFVLDETDETITVGQSGLWRFTGFKRHVIITRSVL